MPPAVRLLFLCLLFVCAQLVLHFRHVLASALRLTVIPSCSRGRLIHASVACAGTASTDHAVTEDVRASLDPGQVMARALGDSAPGRVSPVRPSSSAGGGHSWPGTKSGASARSPKRGALAGLWSGGPGGGPDGSPAGSGNAGGGPAGGSPKRGAGEASGGASGAAGLWSGSLGGGPECQCGEMPRVSRNAALARNASATCAAPMSRGRESGRPAT